ncbi:uncharacterized protein SPAPADRAFT_64512 [Spathaspora passalidarum NRRL Y-27907]|uniref:[histone H3]-trimethyl-L-lysine(9) demethylase n=1 Tax=Spathaspora passalidarum (strain NRRL Y-27907 / 11-Y1) TaxID=619300 RepID=G3AGQ0_SPAPN|nr:uncharacterized protein SPAPADRAFT_64512 [Spathaspora passalidarum NRRL Y-27907]EGW35383.1 hypothetical protein SPAPADRAFT_64512 [Spathaspora passalidarum NRRL Y-27907]
MQHQYSEDPNLIIKPSYYSNGVPVFTPTYNQFHNFYQFNKAINQYGMQSGIVKIIPPAHWKHQLEKSKCYNHDNLENNITIRNPIVQHINQVSPGVYQQENIEKQRKYSIFQWKQLADQQNFQPPRTSTRKRSRQDDKEIVEDSPRKLRHTHSDYNIDIHEFTDDRCAELERIYWKTLTYAEPMYGADMIGSIFPPNIKSWNVAHLPNILDLMDRKIPGVNDAYLYAGLWKATFAWHLEDQDLYSINYLHFGAPKQWYSIPQEYRDKFFNLMKEIFREEYNHCHEFLRHKTFLVSPQVLEKHGIKVNHIVHRQGEFIITYPFGYHAGFNYGYNLAESVNFALDDWFPLGKVSNKCECINDAVTINISQLWSKFHGVEPDAPVKQNQDNSHSNTHISNGHAQKRPIGRPRKNSVRNDIPSEAPEETPSETPSATRECYLCPNSYPQTSPLFDLLPTDANHKIHRICANVFSNQLQLSNNKISNLQSISKQQKQLKCNICHQPNACIQCSYKKCSRSFHPSCALFDGVQFDIPDVYCKYHRSRQSSKPEHVIGKLVQFSINGRYFYGRVFSDNISEETVNIQVLPGLYDIIEVSYNNVLYCNYNENMNYLKEMIVMDDVNADDISKTRSGRKIKVS